MGTHSPMEDDRVNTSIVRNRVREVGGALHSTV